MFWADQGLIGDRLAEVAGIDEAIAIMAEGTSGTYVFDYVKGGAVRRHIVVQEGQVVEESGAKTVLEAPFAGVVVAVSQWVITRRHEIAYGPYLCLATVILIIFGLINGVLWIGALMTAAWPVPGSRKQTTRRQERDAVWYRRPDRRCRSVNRITTTPRCYQIPDPARC